MLRLQLFSLLSVLTLLSVPVVAQESAREAAEQAQESARSAQSATGGNASVSGRTSVSTERTSTAATTTTSLGGLDCEALAEQYEAQRQNYTVTTETIDPLLTKFESYVEETLAVSKDNAGLLEAYTAYNLSKVEYQSDAVRTETSYRFVAELDCTNDRDTYAGELSGVFQVQADQAEAYAALLDNLETTYNSLN